MFSAVLTCLQVHHNLVWCLDNPNCNTYLDYTEITLMSAFELKKVMQVSCIYILQLLKSPKIFDRFEIIDIVIICVCHTSVLLSCSTRTEEYRPHTNMHTP